MGSEGGKETLRRYGRKHFSEIGRKGLAALVSRWFRGDRQSAIDWLHAQVIESQIDKLLDQGMRLRSASCGRYPNHPSGLARYEATLRCARG